MALPRPYASGAEMLVTSMQLQALTSLLHREGLLSAEAVFEHIQEQSVAIAVEESTPQALKDALALVLKDLRSMIDELGPFESRR